MCVIIFIPRGEVITKAELKNAWDVNSDGAGYAIQSEGVVSYERGFMNFKHYWDTVDALQGVSDLMLHLRISTGAGVTPQGTHPYEVGNVLSMKGKTSKAVVCMNGIIWGETLKTKRGAKLNDTASYIVRHEEAFNVLNRDVLRLISENTDALWGVMTPRDVLLSDGFIDVGGVKYSNTNHLWTATSYNKLVCDPFDYDYIGYYGEEEEEDVSLLEHLVAPSLLEDVLNDADLLFNLKEHIREECNKTNCLSCINCISDATTLKDLREFLRINYLTGGF